MGTVHDFASYPSKAEDGADLAKDGGPPHDGDMQSRVTALETRLDTILPTLATREDMHKIDASIKTWMIATVATLLFGMGALIFTVGTSLNSGLNSIKSDVQRSVDIAQAAQSSARAAPGTQPVVIQLPAMYPSQASSVQKPPPKDPVDGNKQ